MKKISWTILTIVILFFLIFPIYNNNHAFCINTNSIQVPLMKIVEEWRTYIKDSSKSKETIKVINNFGKDPATSRNFTWHTSTLAKTGFILYCEKNRFEGFDKENVIRVAAKNDYTVTDSDERVIHKVELNNLKPGTEYIYRVGNFLEGFSPAGSFETAEANVEEFTFIGITDIQAKTLEEYNLWDDTLERALHHFSEARFLLMTGDTVENGDHITQWDYFVESAGNELLNLPIVPVVGNHDALNNNKTNPDMKNFTNRFSISDENCDTGAPSGTVYAFEYGDAHIAVLNTQCSTESLKKQAQWLRQDFSKSNKTWKIVALHRGPYGSVYDTEDIRNVWAPVFDELDVDLVLQGHDHNYSRSFPIEDNDKVMKDQGTVYITGNSGAVKFYPEKERKWQEVNIQTNTPMYLAVTVDRNKIRIAVYDIDDHLIDYYEITKMAAS